MAQTLDTALLSPRTVFTGRPELHIALESHTREHATFAGGADMVAAERMRFFEHLGFRKGIFFFCAVVVYRAARPGAVDFYRRGARSRDELCGRDGEGKDVGWVGLRDRMRLQVLF